MSQQKVALITGISGQDGSYLAEFLLSKGYEVHGIVRRSSSSNLDRISSILNLITLHNADLTDQGSLSRVVNNVNPDEVYNLAAQSFVAASWEQPVATSEMTALGTTRLLEAVRHAIKATGKNIKFYQASSSEMFGNSQAPQNEKTELYPRSPYGVAKVYSHWMTINYRESFGMFAVSGILYNHETNTPETPVLIRRRASHSTNWVAGPMRVVELGEIAPKECRVVNDSPDMEIWDNGKWVELTAISRYIEPNKPITRLLSRSGYVECTNGHVVCGNDIDQPIEKFVVGSKVAPVILPQAPGGCAMDPALAWVIGFFVGDGSLHGGFGVRERGRLEFFNKDLERLKRVEANIKIVDPSAVCVYLPHRSNFKPNNINHKLRVKSDMLRQWCAQCYVEKKPKAIKRIPDVILNASVDIIEYFLDGYNEADGTKSLPKASFQYYYTTKSQILAAGLRLLCHWTGRYVTHNCERRENACSVGYYHKGQIRSKRTDGRNGQHGKSGHNLLKDPYEVRKVWQDTANEFITITTSSGTYSAGTGLMRIHNSPRRGIEFVTRKISNAVARIKLGKQDQLFLGNLDSKRDWGHAKDYVRAMWLMLQQEKPDDFVIGTGSSYSIRDFVQRAFAFVDLDWQKHVQIDKSLYRPAEVNLLLADATKAKRLLGWEPSITLDGLIADMVTNDLQIHKNVS